MKKIFTSAVLLFLASQPLLAQTDKPDDNNAPAGDNETATTMQKAEDGKKKRKIIWMPVLASSPANGFMYGVAPSSNWLNGDPSNTSYSNLLGSIIYTTMNQFLFTAKGNIFSAGNESILMQDIRFFMTSQPTFGLGTGPNSAKLASNGFEYDDGKFSKGIDEAQMQKFNFFRIYETYFKKVNDKGLYGGVGYHLDRHWKIEDDLLDLESDPPVITSDYAYAVANGFKSDSYTLSGISANILYDTRDNTVSPYKGNYALATLKYNPTWLGSTKESSSLWSEYRTYFNVQKSEPRNVIAWWLYGSFELGGTLPYLDLPALGWDQFGRSGRGYPQGRFRGQSVLYTELEWRFPIRTHSEKWGGVAFFNATSATNDDAEIGLFDEINKGYGVGLRYALDKESRTNLALDVGMGDYESLGIYLSVNEVF